MQLTQVQQGSTILASYTYDANGNRATMVTSAGTTTYTYDSADVLLVSKKDPTNKVTNYTYDSNGNLTKAVYDPTGANQATTYKYDTTNRLIEVDKPNGIPMTPMAIAPPRLRASRGCLPPSHQSVMSMREGICLLRLRRRGRKWGR